MRDVRSLKSQGPALAQVTEKLVPSEDKEDGKALVAPLLVTIVIV
jgi:hypothetical protein